MPAARSTAALPRRFVADDDLALTEEHERDVREGREVAAATERSVLGHPRRDAGSEQVEESVGEHRARPAPRHRERARPKEHHRPDHFRLDSLAEPSGVRPDQRGL